MENTKGRKKKNIGGYDSPFASRLRELIDTNNLTLPVLAEAIGVSRQAIGQWREGNTVPDILDLKKLAAYFHVSSDYLLGITDVGSQNMNTKNICEITGLSEDAVSFLISDKSKLETTALNSILTALNSRLLTTSQAFLNAAKIENLHLALLEKFIKEKDINISSELIRKYGKNVFNAKFCGKDEYTRLLIDFEEFEKSYFYTHFHGCTDYEKDYQSYLINKAADMVFSDASIEFLCSDIGSFYLYYYRKLLGAENDEQKISDFRQEEINFSNGLLKN